MSAKGPSINFHGAAKRMSDTDLTVVAGYLGCEVAMVRAVLAVESRNSGFDADKRPRILNEPHVFYRELSGAKRDQAVAAGLAYKVWGTKPYPKTQDARYAWLDQACAIDETAALRSCSWGAGQIMGFNHKACGFDTVQDFVKAMTYSEGAQLYAMARFIVSEGLQKTLRAKNFAGFARGYNGADYAKNKYDTKLAQEYAKQSDKIVPPVPSKQALDELIGFPPPPASVPPRIAPKPSTPKSDANTATGIAVAAGGSTIGAAYAAGFPWWAIGAVVAVVIVLIVFLVRAKKGT